MSLNINLKIVFCVKTKKYSKNDKKNFIYNVLALFENNWFSVEFKILSSHVNQLFAQ